MIQSAQEKHLDEILKIEKRVFTHPCNRKQLKRDLNLRTNAENWAFLKNQKVVGYILGWKVMDEFHLNNLAAHTDFQLRYIGWSLVEHVSAHLHNQDIQRFYESLGFQQKSMRMDYYTQGDNALFYHLDLIAND